MSPSRTVADSNFWASKQVGTSTVGAGATSATTAVVAVVSGAAAVAVVSGAAAAVVSGVDAGAVVSGAAATVVSGVDAGAGGGAPLPQAVVTRPTTRNAVVRMGLTCSLRARGDGDRRAD